MKRKLTRVGPTATIRDKIIRSGTDPYTLPLKQRYTTDYYNSRRVGNEKFELICTHTKSHYEDDETILELGCGAGNITVEFAHRNNNLNYIGIEPQAELISHLKKHYKHTPFQFQHVDLKNDCYNPDGNVDPSTVNFDFGDKQFDLVILCSVFTHVRPETVENYLSQFSDFLKPDGKVWATSYLITEDDDRWLKDDRDFETEHDGFYSPYKTNPERSIAYREEDMIEKINSAGLKINDCIYGSWRGDGFDFDRNVFYQDALVLESVER